MIRTLIVDDDPFVRMSLQTILEAQDDVEVCALGADGDEAVELFERERPDVLLMDIQMPGSDGLGAAERILGAHKHARIVFLTTFSDDEYIVRALRLGAKGYLIKQEVATIAPALRTVMAGQSVLGGEVLDRMDVLMSRGPACAENAPGGEMRSGLTERESAIVELVAEGLDNKEIAARLYLSEGTVRNHISSESAKNAVASAASPASSRARLSGASFEPAMASMRMSTAVMRVRSHALPMT